MCPPHTNCLYFIAQMCTRRESLSAKVTRLSLWRHESKWACKKIFTSSSKIMREQWAEWPTYGCHKFPNNSKYLIGFVSVLKRTHIFLARVQSKERYRWSTQHSTTNKEKKLLGPPQMQTTRGANCQNTDVRFKVKWWAKGLGRIFPRLEQLCATKKSTVEGHRKVLQFAENLDARFLVSSVWCGFWWGCSGVGC